MILTKSQKCPEYDGNEEHLTKLSDIWQLWKKQPYAATQMWRNSNTTRISTNRIRDLKAVLPSTEYDSLIKFLMDFIRTFGLEQIVSLSKRQQLYLDARQTVIGGGGKRIKLSLTRAHPSRDDRKNGAFYLDRQLSILEELDKEQ